MLSPPSPVGAQLAGDGVREIAIASKLCSYSDGAREIAIASKLCSYSDGVREIAIASKLCSYSDGVREIAIASKLCSYRTVFQRTFRMKPTRVSHSASRAKSAWVSWFSSSQFSGNCTSRLSRLACSTTCGISWVPRM